MFQWIKTHAKTIRRLFACIAFVIVTIHVMAAGQLLINDVNDVTSVNVLKAIPKESLDVAFIGSSHVFGTINPMRLFQDHGIVSALVCTASETLDNSYWEMELLYQTQSPEVIVLDVYKAASPYLASNLSSAKAKYTGERRLQRGLLPTNPLKFQTFINDFINCPEALPLNSTYWTRHQTIYDLNREALQNTIYLPSHKQINLGNTGVVATAKLSEADMMPVPYNPNNSSTTLKFFTFTDEQLQQIHLSDESKKTLDQMIALANKHNTALVFTSIPFFTNAAEEKIYAEIGEYVTERGAIYLSHEHITEKIGGLKRNDMVDLGHIAHKKALLVSNFFGQYLKEEHHISDRRESNDPLYNYWVKNQDHPNAQQAITSLKKQKTLQDYLNTLNSLDEYYLIIVAKNGLNAATNADIPYTVDPDTILQTVETLAQQESNSYFALIQNQQPLTYGFHSMGHLLYENYISHTPFSAHYANNVFTIRCDTNVTEVLDGYVNIIVYDMVNGSFIDKACFSVEEGNITISHKPL